MDNYQKEILEKIVQGCRQSVEPVSKIKIKELQKKLKELKTIVDNSQDAIKFSNVERWRSYGFSEANVKVFKNKGAYTNEYPKALHLITEILDILRGEPLMITVQIVEGDKITTYVGKESDLTLITNSKYRQIEYDLNDIKKKFTKLESSSKENADYYNHYIQFSNIAKKHIKHTRSLNKQTQKYIWRSKINEGHITEAFQRHVIMRHKGLIADSKENYKEKIDDATVMILLYYSLGNTGWWQQGDIGYMQVKAANNRRLASLKSISVVASKLISLFDAEEFDYEEFNKMFTKQDQEEMTDWKTFAEDQKKKLIDEIYKNKRFKDIRKKDFQL